MKQTNKHKMPCTPHPCEHSFIVFAMIATKIALLFSPKQNNYHFTNLLQIHRIMHTKGQRDQRFFCSVREPECQGRTSSICWDFCSVFWDSAMHDHAWWTTNKAIHFCNTESVYILPGEFNYPTHFSFFFPVSLLLG